MGMKNGFKSYILYFDGLFLIPMGLCWERPGNEMGMKNLLRKKALSRAILAVYRRIRGGQRAFQAQLRKTD